jgi:hypothetical protein
MRGDVDKSVILLAAARLSDAALEEVTTLD